MDISPYVGPAIRAFRQEAGLSQEELAARADLDRTYISGVERGRRNPTVNSLQAIVAAMNTRLDLLFVRAHELAAENRPRARGKAASRQPK